MCGIAGLIHRGKTANIGQEMKLLSVWVCDLDAVGALWFIALTVSFYAISYRGIVAREANTQKD